MQKKKGSHKLLIIIFSILLISSVSTGALLALKGDQSTGSSGTDTGSGRLPISTEITEAASADDSASDRLTFLDNKKNIGSNSNAWYVDNEAINSMTYPDIIVVGDYLVAYYIQYTCEDSGFIDINVISLVDGSVTASKQIPCSSYIRLQTGSSQIALCDINYSQITIYDTSLNITKQYTITDDYSDYCLSTDMTMLYGIDYSDNINCTVLSTGEAVPFNLDGMNIYFSDITDSSALLCYVDKTTQLNCNRLLDLTTGELSELPVSNVYYCRYASGSWLTAKDSSFGYYIYTFTDSNNKSSVIEWDGNSFNFSHDGSGFIGTDTDNHSLYLYNTAGSFMSGVSMPDSAHIGSQVVWSDMWNGYFFISYDSDDSETGRLSFWDPSVTVSGTDLNMKETESADYSKDSSGLYEKAKSIGDKYDVDIRIMDQCQLDYGIYYSSDIYTDPDGISAFLDMLDMTLSKYPDGFFRQLRYGSIQQIQIELVQNLVPKDGSGVGSTAAAFTQEQSDYYLMVCDADFVGPSVIYHETTHIIDNRLAWDTSIRDDALFNEDTWASLNPAGDTYSYSYDDWASNTIGSSSVGYYIYEYSLTFPTEDRATMMEYAMSGELNDREYWSGILKKLEYYSNCIRDCFDTDGWPEKTAWEIY